MKAIEDLDVDIKKYFLTSNWSVFKPKAIKRRYFSVLKYILKDMGLTYKTKTQRVIVYENEKSKTSSITFITIIE